MCEFISWIEFKDEILYMTDRDLETSNGRKLLKDVGYEDIEGHGLIRKFYNIADGKGKNKECEDFSTPDNFPFDIVRDIKKGLFSRFGVAVKILTKPARAQYDAARKTARVQYGVACQTGRAQYDTACKTAFWEIVNIKENRIKAWQ